MRHLLNLSLIDTAELPFSFKFVKPINNWEIWFFRKELFVVYKKIEGKMLILASIAHINHKHFKTQFRLWSPQNWEILFITFWKSCYRFQKLSSSVGEIDPTDENHLTVWTNRSRRLCYSWQRVVFVLVSDADRFEVTVDISIDGVHLHQKALDVLWGVPNKIVDECWEFVSLNVNGLEFGYICRQIEWLIVWMMRLNRIGMDDTTWFAQMALIADGLMDGGQLSVLRSQIVTTIIFC
jgi:hypothetical protein